MQLQDTESSNDVTDSEEVNKDEKKLKRRKVSQKLCLHAKRGTRTKSPLEGFHKNLNVL